MSFEGLNTRQKALKINLNPQTYGTFAEIGAGQEVAAWFFKAGAASGTIAKTMSAYDMTFSDAIYGKEESGRYVCESRLEKMLTKEYNLLDERLKSVRPADTLFFAFANTVVTLNYNKTNESHGWVGIRFQLRPNTEPNELVIHMRLLDNDTLLQQQVVGIIGVNLVFAAYYLHDNSEAMITSLMDGLNSSKVEVDLIRLTGPDFRKIDNRLLSLLLVTKGLTNAALFDKNGFVLQPSEAFYKKNILLLRGRFRPCTHVNMDMIRTGNDQFSEDKEVNSQNIIAVSELTLNNLKEGDHINYQDFLDRVEILCSLGQNVLISNYHEYFRVVEYLSKFTKEKIGIVLGLQNLSDIFNEDYYKQLKGGILESFGTLFSRNVKLYVYPMMQRDSARVLTCVDFELPNHLLHLYKYLEANNKIEDILGAGTEFLHIYSDQVIKMIKAGEKGWEDMVPAQVSEAIMDRKLFGYHESLV